MSIRYRFANFILGGGGETMVEVYVALILEGRKTIDNVPPKIRDKVKETLEALGIED